MAEELANSWKSIKGWFGGIFKTLNFLRKSERLLKESTPSVKANVYFSYFILAAILIWLIILLVVSSVTRDENITGMFIVQTIGAGFIVLILTVIFCNVYHNRRPVND